MSDPRRLVLETEPFNAEVPLTEVARAPGEGALFVRSHFPMPDLDDTSHVVHVRGAVARPRAWSLADLRSRPSSRLAVTLECAGNGRSLVEPKPPGTPWKLGATGSAVFEGVFLQELLDESGPAHDAVEVLATGADRGKVASGSVVFFERSLPLAALRRSEVLVAHTMNGVPLAPEHGAPVRLVVPGWYGVASVKWLTHLEVLRAPFTGWFQRSTYVYDGEAGLPRGTPVGPMRVRALITSPGEGAALPHGPVTVSGAAWSGSGPVVAVALSADEGASWSPVQLDAEDGPWLRRLWRGTWTPPAPGTYTLLARATDGTGATQPLTPVWNRLGYGNNAVHRVGVTVL
ncbi:MAG TPA: sulfite oxidase [Candidatus Polarisedimenticolaceae bacterium]|nr:sulfite oxidase [Candidatus Polarisedimenticolaceae bacterium]